MRVSGDATVIVYRSTPDGRSQRVSSASTDSDPTGDFSFGLTLKPFGDGGWYWFDISSGNNGAVLEEAYWSADVPLERADQGTATVGITTFNRADSCVQLLGQLADDIDVLKVLDDVVVVDQGTEQIKHEPDFPRVESAMGGKLRVIEQGNRRRTSIPPFGVGRRPVEFDGRSVPKRDHAPQIGAATISPAFFDAAGVSVIRGRGFTDADGAAGAENVIINERMASEHFKTEDRIGKRIRFMQSAPSTGQPAPPPAVWRTVIGIVPTIRHAQLADAVSSAMTTSRCGRTRPASCR